MSSDYYTLIAPYYTALRIPNEIGYHLLAYCNRLDQLQPDGSTNFARLASVNLNIEASDIAEAQSLPGNTATTETWDPTHHATEARFDIVITAGILPHQGEGTPSHSSQQSLRPTLQRWFCWVPCSLRFPIFFVPLRIFCC